MKSAVFTVILILLLVINGCQLLYDLSIKASLKFLRRQLEELQAGSQMDLCVQSRQPHVLALCKTLNALLRQKQGNYQQYEQAQKQLKQTITGLAHDIRTPLTGAVGYAQLAQECGQLPVRQRYLETALLRMKELEDMLEELFLYTKLTCGEFEPDLRQMQVLPLLSDCLIGMYSQFEARGMVPDVDFSCESFRVLADEECLRRIFENLIRNALLHGTGEFTVRQTGSCLIFENTVPESDRPDPEQIFDRFYKADAARRKGSSGLGLFIVKELAEKMNGRVKAQLCGEKLRIILDLSQCLCQH